MTWKNEAAFWKAVRTQWDKQGIGYTRIESPLSPGFPDVVAYRTGNIQLFEIKLSRLKNEISTVLRNDQYLLHRKLWITNFINVFTITGIQHTGEIAVFGTGVDHRKAFSQSKGWKYGRDCSPEVYNNLQEIDWKFYIE